MKKDLGANGLSRAEPKVSALRASIPSACRNCGGVEWVCENHSDLPWGGLSHRGDACDCGAGMPCGACNLVMASAGFSEPWRELADRAIAMVESAVRETNWGQPTFGPDYGDELRNEYDKILSAQFGSEVESPQDSPLA